MNRIQPRRVVRQIGLLGAASATLVAALAGCSSDKTASSNGAFGFPEAKQDKSSTITVWVDATRVPAVKAFELANPSIDVKTVTYDGSANGSNSFKTKMALYDRAGKGWPDVVFSTQNNDAAWASRGVAGKQAFAARLDKGLIPSSTLSGFAQGALNPCTVNGVVYCLRNDLAQTVLWYNDSLLKKFGYTLPTTWEEYQALGEKVAREHPGYIVGSVGDTFTPEVFMWSSKCQANEVTGARSVTVNTDSTECKRAAGMIDTLVADKALTPLSVFTPDFVKQYTGKVLMMPGPAWYAGAIFNNPESLNVPKGQLGVAAPLAWEGDSAVAGNVGGGTWFISSHSANLANAAKFAEFVTTADAYQVDEAPGYPAFAAAAAKWVGKQEASGYYVTDLSALTTAAGAVWDGWGFPSFSQEAIWAKTMTPLLASGKSIEANLGTWGSAIKDQAQVSGYKVND
jgi:ABC-type glycerol-3-phosphate transport system substrate-binding protein